jgi:hypothetical protein
LLDAINAIVVFVEPVIAELKLDKQGNQHKNRQPESKPKNIYKGEELVSPDIADSGFKVVCYHVSGFKVPAFATRASARDPGFKVQSSKEKMM